MYIFSLLEQIKNEEIVLPDIQRDFVWDEKRIEKLFDSIMRVYPIGLILLWETYNNIQYRKFGKDYLPPIKTYRYYNNTNNNRLKLVLDGQQRLQSLYTSIYGIYNGKYLYFDILSGLETDDFKEDKYVFRFYRNSDIEEINNFNIENIEKIKNNEKCYYCKLMDLISMSPIEKQKFIKDIVKVNKLTDEEELRVRQNIDTLNYVLTQNQNILKATIIDDNLPRDNPERKSESDVLEAFVRINRQGMRLSRSDLIFSFLKLNWNESAIKLPEFISQVNEGNSFDIDVDFVIRCLFAVSNFGTKFDVDLLRNKSNVEKIRNNFNKCCAAIRSTLDFVQNYCWIESSKLLGGYYNLVPFVYYLFYAKDHQVPNKQIDKVRKTIYLFGFTSPFSRYADSRLGKFIREELEKMVDKKIFDFPLGNSVWWVWYWEKIDNYGTQLLQGNPDLVHHLIQRRSGGKVLYEKNSPQIDHIFPRSILRTKKYDESEINHFANFWILAKNKNQNKSNKPPQEYFADVSNTVLKRAYIDKNLLSYDKYKEFIKKRERLILKKIKKDLGLTNYDYNVRHYYKID